MPKNYGCRRLGFIEMDIEDRPFTKRQRAQLEAYVAIKVEIFRAILFLLAVTIIGAFFRKVQLQFYDGVPVWLVPTLLIAGWLYVRAGRWTGGRELRKRIRQDLATGMAKVLIIEPEQVIQVEEIEDEGPSFIIETKSGETVLLTGQYLSPAKARKFPWSRFEIVEAPRSLVFFGLKNIGDPISITAKHKPFSYETAKKLGCFDHDYLILDEEAKALVNTN